MSGFKGEGEIIKHFGTFDFDPNYDYKAARRKKRT